MSQVVKREAREKREKAGAGAAAVVKKELPVMQQKKKEMTGMLKSTGKLLKGGARREKVIQKII